MRHSKQYIYDGHVFIMNHGVSRMQMDSIDLTRESDNAYVHTYAMH
jgi:hypothetical protein